MIKSMWSGLSPSKKKVVAIIGAIGVVLVAVFAMSSIGGNDQRKQGGKQTIGRVLYDGDPRSVGIDSINSKQRDQEKTITEVQRNLKTLLEQSNNQKVITDSLKTVQQSVDDLKGQVSLAKDGLK